MPEKPFGNENVEENSPVDDDEIEDDQDDEVCSSNTKNIIFRSSRTTNQHRILPMKITDRIFLMMVKELFLLLIVFDCRVVVLRSSLSRFVC